MSDEEFGAPARSGRAGRGSDFRGASSHDVASGEPAREGFRDRDPPPTYDGNDPEATFRTFEKNVRLWEHESDIPRSKRGTKLFRALSGTAQIATEQMEFDEIASEDGVRNIMTRLREFFSPHLEVSLPRAFENPRHRGGNPGPQSPARCPSCSWIFPLFLSLPCPTCELPW